jgi:putative multicomponent Na+:H+ antiporter subunit B
MNDSYIYVIIALLPLAACMLVFQVNPYNALVIRGILGAIAAMVYAVLGAADVALTEALVGTMLAITLYAVAVRSSLVMRLGLLEDELNQVNNDRLSGQLIDNFRRIFGKHYMRLDLVPYTNTEELQRALMEKEVHAICLRPEANTQDLVGSEDENPTYHTQTRIQRIYEIMQTELSSSATILSYVSTPKS